MSSQLMRSPARERCCPCPATSGCSKAPATTFTHDNTATRTGSETNLTAGASVTVDCDDIQRPSLGVEQVTVSTAVNDGATVTGSFVIKNHSGGSITRVTLGNVTLSFVSRRPGGIAVDHSAICTVTPQANGYELQPHEAKQFSYSCTIRPAVPTDATELTARVTVVPPPTRSGRFARSPSRPPARRSSSTAEGDSGSVGPPESSISVIDRISHPTKSRTSGSGPVRRYRRLRVGRALPAAREHRWLEEASGRGRTNRQPARPE